MGESKILVIVEGEKEEVNLMDRMLKIYGIHENHIIIPYKTNIYNLYKDMFENENPEYNDILQVLKTRERDDEKRRLLDSHFSDILLIFDFDPQDHHFTADKIRKMQEYFIESSDMGKLYLNYPMVESFYHMKSIPDNSYFCYIVTMQELKDKKYKGIVGKINTNRSFAKDKSDYNMIIKQNMEKALQITNTEKYEDLSLTDVLSAQLTKLSQEQSVFVLCTCVFYIPDYNPKWIT